MRDPNSISFAGDVDVKSAYVTSYNGSEMNVIELIQRIDIYEDLYSPFLTLDIVISDAIGLLNKMPMIGEETITLDITDATGLGLKKKEFFIYKIKDRVFTADKTNVYTMCCISIEAVYDLNLKISKSFVGQPSDIAMSLLKDLGLQTDVATYVEPTKNNIQFIANYWSPVQILKFLCDRSISKDTNSPTYLFYETINGFFFISQDFMVSQNTSSKFTLTNRSDNDISKSFERINKIYIDEEFDYITRLNNGMYGNRLLQVNPLSKSYNYRYIDFTTQFQNSSRLNTEPIGTSDATRRLNSHLITKTVPSSAYSKMQFDGMSQWYQQRKIELATRDAQNIQIDAVGRFNLSVGMVSDVFIYTEAPKNTESTEQDMNSLLDKTHSGRHLVTAIHHVINKGEGHQMFVSLSKDSMVK